MDPNRIRNTASKYCISLVSQVGSKKPLLVPKEKENKMENGQQGGGGPLKGFALFMAEHPEVGGEEDAQQAALAAWKALDKADKEAYKLPR
jgi:hypothetical protein